MMRVTTTAMVIVAGIVRFIKLKTVRLLILVMKH